MKTGLTASQSKVLKFIRGYWHERGFSPSYRDIEDYFDYGGPKAVQDHLACLERKGYIKRTPGVARSIVLKGKSCVSV